MSWLLPAICIPVAVIVFLLAIVCKGGRKSPSTKESPRGDLESFFPPTIKEPETAYTLEVSNASGLYSSSSFDRTRSTLPLYHP